MRDLDLTYDDVRMALSAHLVAAGMGYDVIGAVVFEDMLTDEVDQTIRDAMCWEPRAVVGRRLDAVYLRMPAVR